MNRGTENLSFTLSLLRFPVALCALAGVIAISCPDREVAIVKMFLILFTIFSVLILTSSPAAAD